MSCASDSLHSLSTPSINTIYRIMSLLARLPQDVLYEILKFVRIKHSTEYVNPDKYLVDCLALSNLSKTCKEFRDLVQPELFRSLLVRGTLSSSLNLIKVLTDRPDLANTVQCVSSDETNFQYDTPKVPKDSEWVITPAEAAHINQLFDKFNIQRKNYSLPEGENIERCKLEPLSAKDVARRKRPHIAYEDAVTLAILLCRNIRQVKLYHMDQAFSYMATPEFTFPNLKELCLYAHSSNDSRALEGSLGWFFKAAPALENIRAEAVWKVEPGLFSHPSLAELALHYSCIDVKALQDIMAAFPKLQRFLYRADTSPYHIFDLKDVTPREVVDGLLPVKDTLTRLCLGFQYAEAWEHDLWTEEDTTLQGISQLNNLTELELSCYGLAYPGTIQEADGRIRPETKIEWLVQRLAAPGLEQLKLWDIGEVSDLANIAEILPELFPSLKKFETKVDEDDMADEVVKSLPEMFAKHGITLQFFEDEDGESI